MIFKILVNWWGFCKEELQDNFSELLFKQEYIPSLFDLLTTLVEEKTLVFSVSFQSRLHYTENMHCYFKFP